MNNLKFTIISTNAAETVRAVLEHRLKAECKYWFLPPPTNVKLVGVYRLGTTDTELMHLTADVNLKMTNRTAFEVPVAQGVEADLGVNCICYVNHLTFTKQG